MWMTKDNGSMKAELEDVEISWAGKEEEEEEKEEEDWVEECGRDR